MNFIQAMAIVEDGFSAWAAKAHNRRWVRLIDGTPIPNDLKVNIAEAVARNAEDDPEVRHLNNLVVELTNDLGRLWHFAGCPFDHCETCIADAEWIESLEKRLGPPSAMSVQAQHDNR